MKKMNKTLLALGTAFLVIFSAGCSKRNTQFKMDVAVKDNGSKTFNDVTVMETVKAMKTGWNLGNTMDAIATNDMRSEISWGQPLTKKSMIDDLAASGIKTIRIPTSWSNHIIDEKYTIDPAWMERVKTIVDWAIENDMYVILNAHHDNYDKPSVMPPCSGYYPNAANLEESKRYLTNVWAQIALAFNNGYDEHLIFETMNEPRLRGTANEWWNDKGSAGYNEAADALNQMNQAALDAIRASGGNNQKRFVMIPGLRAAVDSVVAPEFKLPADDAPGKLIISVHMYDPYEFAMQGNGPRKFTQNHKQTLVRTFMSLNNTYISAGVPVVIGEYGATNKDNLEERVEWFKFFLKGSRKYGMTACLWDNGVSEPSVTETERFGYYDRRAAKWFFPEILAAINEATTE